MLGGAAGSSRSRPAARRWRFAAVAVVVFALGALQKATCLGEPSSDVLRKYCFAGLQFLWRLRGFSVDAVPYAGPPPGYPFDYVLEYPPASHSGRGCWRWSPTRGPGSSSSTRS